MPVGEEDLEIAWVSPPFPAKICIHLWNLKCFWKSSLLNLILLDGGRKHSEVSCSLLCQPSVERNSTKLLGFALLCEGESLKPVCNLLSSLGGPYWSHKHVYVFIWVLDSFWYCCFADQARAVLLTPDRTAAASLVAAGPSSMGITCRGNTGWKFPVIPSSWDAQAGSEGFPAARSLLLAADIAELISAIDASLLTQGFQEMRRRIWHRAARLLI